MRVTLLTPAGRGALAVVGVGGKAALELVTRLFTPRGGTPLAERPLPAIVFGTWREADGPGEDVVVVRRGPEDFEIHCHGGRAAAEALLSAIARLGGRIQPWAEWLVAGGRPESEIEAREALARAGGPKAARILSRQLAGRLEAEVARVESLVRHGRSAAAAALLERLARAARVGLRLTRPWRVVVAGPVNAGKSSLVNALAGHARAIVSPEAGTTRDVLETRIVLAGWEVDLVDTAGLRGADDHAVAAVEREGIARAAAACASADLVVRVWDATGPSLPPATAPGELVVRSKADLAARPADPVGAGAATAVPTSAVTGQGIGELAARIVRRLVPEEADDPALLAGAVPFTPRQVRWIAAVRATLRSGDDGEGDGGGGGGHAPIAGA